MSMIAEKCIFCDKKINPYKIPPEHIIPRSIDGSIVAYNVCAKCNNDLGSEVDCELNRNRHIWDGRKRHKELPPPQKPFIFKSKFAITPDGTKVPLVPNSGSDQILTHTLKDSGTRVDRRCPPENDFYFQWLKKQLEMVGTSTEEQKKHFERYLRAREKGSYLGKKIYRDWLFTGMEAFFGEEENIAVHSLMSTTVPHRFIAKVCLEYAHLLNFEKEIENIKEIKEHALNGGLEGTALHFYNEVSKESDIFPCHIFAFTKSQFVVGIYDSYFIGVDIKWREKPMEFIYADDFVNRLLRVCIERDGFFEIFLDRSFDFKEHALLGRPTHL